MESFTTAYEIQLSIRFVDASISGSFCVILLHPDNRAYHRQVSRIYSANDNDFQHNEFVRLLLLLDDVFMLLFIEWNMHFSCGMISADDSDGGAQEKIQFYLMREDGAGEQLMMLTRTLLKMFKLK